jgi:hypothetical protein
MRKAKRIVSWSVIPMSLLLVLGLALAGCGSGTNISDILKKSEQAEATITSMHQEVDTIWEQAQAGKGTVATNVINVSGSNMSYTQTLLGQNLGETIIYNGTQYTKKYGETTWTTTPASSTTPSTATAGVATSQFSNLVNNTQSQKDLGKEMVNGYNCYHFQFELSPDNIRNLIQQVPKENVAANNGGMLDIWIDEQNSYLVKEQAVFNNVTYPNTDLGFINLTILLSRTNINQPVAINPPQ